MTHPDPNPAPAIDRRINVVPPVPPPAIVQETDRVPSGRIAVIFVAALLVIAVAVVVVIGAEQHPSSAHGVVTKPAPRTLFGVHQTPIAGPSYASHLREQQERALHSYAIIDEKAGVASIPIDAAKRIYLQRSAANGSPGERAP